MATDLIVIDPDAPWVCDARALRSRSKNTPFEGARFQGLVLRTLVELHGEGLTTQGEFTVAAGQRIPFVLTYAPSHLPLPDAVDPEAALAETAAFWAEWSGRHASSGPTPVKSSRNSAIGTFTLLKKGGPTLILLPVTHSDSTGNNVPQRMAKHAARRTRLLNRKLDSRETIESS